MSDVTKRTCARSVGAIDIVLAAILAAIALPIGFGIVTFWPQHDRLSIDPTSNAYHLGYSNTYREWTGHRYAGALRNNPEGNPYLTMPKNEWEGYAAAQASKGDEGQCDPFHVGTGDWHDYAEGGNRALQDIALGFEARIHLSPGDPDCD